jgi:hypothetical protein
MLRFIVVVAVVLWAGLAFGQSGPFPSALSPAEQVRQAIIEANKTPEQKAKEAEAGRKRWAEMDKRITDAAVYFENLPARKWGASRIASAVAYYPIQRLSVGHNGACVELKDKAGKTVRLEIQYGSLFTSADSKHSTGLNLADTKYLLQQVKKQGGDTSALDARIKEQLAEMKGKGKRYASNGTSTKRPR